MLSPNATQLCRGDGEDLADGVVELAYAREPGGECYLGDRLLRRLYEQSGSVSAPRAGEREWTSPDLGRKQAVQVALRVAEPPREAGDTLPVDDAISDEPHRPRDDVGPGIPFRRARYDVGPAPLASPETSVLRGGRGRKKPDVGPPRGNGRTTGPAVDPRGGDSDVKPAVEAGVATTRGAIAMFEVL